MPYLPPAIFKTLGIEPIQKIFEEFFFNQNQLLYASFLYLLYQNFNKKSNDGFHSCRNIPEWDFNLESVLYYSFGATNLLLYAGSVLIPENIRKTLFYFVAFVLKGFSDAQLPEAV